MSQVKFSLAEQCPDFAAELAGLLDESGEKALAQTVPSLPVVDRCRGGDDFCATMYTAPHPHGAWGQGHRSIALHADTGDLILAVVQDGIVAVEGLYREELRERLLTLMP